MESTRHLTSVAGILEAKGETLSVTKPALEQLPNRVSKLALVLWALAAPGCVSKANPILSSTGNPAQSGLVGSEGLDGGATDALLADDVQDDAADSAAANGPCDLLTFIRTGQGCPTSPILQACYPVSGSGKCQDAGSQGVYSPCVLGDTSGDTTQRCAPQLACISTPDMGPICAFLCDANQLACNGGNRCVPIGPTSAAGTCQL
jgi:hypothetical protein